MSVDLASVNPFTPVFGKVPAYVAGRTQLVDDISSMLGNPENDPSSVSVFVGARGMGKTALLSLFSRMAQADGWITVRVTAAPGMLDEILMRVKRSASHLLDELPQRRLRSLEVANVGSVEWENTEAEPANWRLKMDDVFDRLERTGTRLLITVDEVDPQLGEMAALVRAYQHFLDEGRQTALLMAGLPFALSSLLSGKSTSFLRRAARYDLGPIADADVAEAFEATMRQGGKSAGSEALAEAVDGIGGFPYMLQLVGYRAWKLAGEEGSVSVGDVRLAVEIARRELAERVYEATYYELTAADRAFLKAMLADGAVTRQADLSSRLNRQSGHVSKYKKRLLQQGIIQERSKGVIEFCLPGFREYFEQREGGL